MTDILVTWENLNDRKLQKGDVEEYTITVKGPEETDGQSILIQDVTSTSNLVSGLKPFVNYTVTMKTKNAQTTLEDGPCGGGYGKDGLPSTATTYPDSKSRD